MEDDADEGNELPGSSFEDEPNGVYPSPASAPIALLAEVSSTTALGVSVVVSVAVAVVVAGAVVLAVQRAASMLAVANAAAAAAARSTVWRVFIGAAWQRQMRSQQGKTNNERKTARTSPWRPETYLAHKLTPSCRERC